MGSFAKRKRKKARDIRLKAEAIELDKEAAPMSIEIACKLAEQLPEGTQRQHWFTELDGWTYEWERDIHPWEGKLHRKWVKPCWRLRRTKADANGNRWAAHYTISVSEEMYIDYEKRVFNGVSWEYHRSTKKLINGKWTDPHKRPEPVEV
jgi:hypothetical protein